MINLKYSAGGALAGLIISFVSGLLGGVPFGTVILRALVSAVVFGGVTTLAYFLFGRFLAVDVAVPEASSQPAATGTVDITIGDEPLPDTDNSPEFVVPAMVKAVPASQLQQAGAASAAPEREPASREAPKAPAGPEERFVPTSLGAMTAQTPPKTEASAPSEKSATGSLAEFDGMAMMPNIEDLGSLPEAAPETVVSEAQPSYQEPTASVIPTSSVVSDVSVGTDASLMAQAIRTLLKSEG